MSFLSQGESNSMAKYVIFCIHGMGDGWPTSGNKLPEAIISAKFDATRYPALQNFGGQFDVALIDYNSIFDAELKKREEYFGDLSASLGDVSKGLQQFVNAASLRLNLPSPLDAVGPFDRSWLDVLTYRYCRLRDYVRCSVGKQIAEKLKAMPKDDEYYWGVIALSLGTAVIHDVLNLFATKNLIDPSNKRPIEWLADVPPMRVLLMLANTSRLLEKEFDPYASTAVVPDERGTMTQHYINAWHRLDPIARTRRFDPGNIWFQNDRYSDVQLKKISGSDIHSFRHYFADPRVHVPFFRALLNDGERLWFTDRQYSKACQDYDAENQLTLDDLENKLDQLDLETSDKGPLSAPEALLRLLAG